jgi:hypothetical protein
LDVAAGLGDVDRIAQVYKAKACSQRRWNGEELLAGGRTALGGTVSSTGRSVRQIRCHGDAGVAWVPARFSRLYLELV